MNWVLLYVKQIEGYNDMILLTLVASEIKESLPKADSGWWYRYILGV